jgi:hypothetical protein
MVVYPFIYRMVVYPVRIFKRSLFRHFDIGVCIRERGVCIREVSVLERGVCIREESVLERGVCIRERSLY